MGTEHMGLYFPFIAWAWPFILGIAVFFVTIFLMPKLFQWAIALGWLCALFGMFSWGLSDTAYKRNDASFLAAHSARGKESICAIEVKFVRIPPSKLRFIKDAPSKDMSFFALSITPKTFSPQQCSFEIVNNEVEIYTYDSEVRKGVAKVTGDVIGVHPFIPGEFHGKVITPRPEYRFIEARLKIAIRYSGSDNVKLVVTSATFSKNELIASNFIGHTTAAWSRGNDYSELLNAALEAAEWVTPGAVSKSLRFVRKADKAR